MAVIVTNMDIPKGCTECKFNPVNIGSCYLTDSGWTSQTGRHRDCPLKSADEMIAEIKYHQNKTAPIDKYDLVGDCIDIIHRYCDKEQEDGNDKRRKGTYR